MDKYSVILNTYNKLAQQYQDKFMDWDGYHETYDLFCQRVEKKNATILEIACGPGNVTKYLLSKRPDFKILGTDLAPNMIELAKANNPTAEFRLMDCRDIGQINEKYDAIMCGFCLPYISKEEAIQLIHDASQLLHPNGLFYLSTMEDDYEKSGFQNSSSSKEKMYIHYHQADYLMAALKENGFEVVDLLRKDYLEEGGGVTVDLFVISRCLTS